MILSRHKHKLFSLILPKGSDVWVVSVKDAIYDRPVNVRTSAIEWHFQLFPNSTCGSISAYKKLGMNGFFLPRLYILHGRSDWIYY